MPAAGRSGMRGTRRVHGRGVKGSPMRFVGWLIVGGAVSATQGVRRFARIRVSGLIDGIAFDRTGAFAHRLLVTVNRGTKTAVLAVDCHGNLSTIARSAPRVEGGIAVAPATFGHFAGD